SLRKRPERLPLLLEPVIARFTVDLSQPLQEEVTLILGGSAVLVELSVDSDPRGQRQLPQLFQPPPMEPKLLGGLQAELLHDLRFGQSAEPAVDQVFVTDCHRTCGSAAAAFVECDSCRFRAAGLPEAQGRNGIPPLSRL